MKIEPADLARVLGGVLDEVATLLESLGMSYALVGGLAVAIHAQARATKDVDLAEAVHAFVPISRCIASSRGSATRSPRRRASRSGARSCSHATQSGSRSCTRKARRPRRGAD